MNQPRPLINTSDEINMNTYKQWRKSSGLTLRKLSEIVGVDFTYLSKIENGHEVPSVGLIERMGAASGIDPREVDRFIVGSGRLPSWAESWFLRNAEMAIRSHRGTVGHAVMPPREFA